MDRDWPGAWAGSQPARDDVAVDQERCGIATRVAGLRSFAEERSVGNADRRDIQHKAEVEGEAGTPWVVAAGRVEEQHARALGERLHGALEAPALAQREQARRVRRARRTGDDGGCGFPAAQHDGSGPRRVAAVAGPRLAARKAHPGGAD